MSTAVAVDEMKTIPFILSLRAFITCPAKVNSIIRENIDLTFLPADSSPVMPGHPC
jgi:hypothetical protein